MPLNPLQMEAILNSTIPNGQAELVEYSSPNRQAQLVEYSSPNHAARTEVRMNRYLCHMDKEGMTSALGNFIYHYERQEAPGKTAAETVRCEKGMQASRMQLTNAIEAGLQAAGRAGETVNIDASDYADFIIKKAQDQLRQTARSLAGGG